MLKEDGKEILQLLMKSIQLVKYAVVKRLNLAGMYKIQSVT